VPKSRDLAHFVLNKTYAKKPDEKWADIAGRIAAMFKDYYKEKNIDDLIDNAFSWVITKKVLSSQRLAQYAGPATLKNHVRAYNCTGTHCDRPLVFGQAFFILMSGSGAGVSVQQHHINKLSSVTLAKNDTNLTHVIHDSIEGWADAVHVLVANNLELPVPGFEQYNAKNGTVHFDFSKIRPEGKEISSGGVAPGPRPLKNALLKIKDVFEAAKKSWNKRLTALNCIDILCHLSDAVLAGGVRRSATLTLISPHDTEAMDAKTGNWWVDNPQRGRVNISVAFNVKTCTKDQYNKLLASTYQYGEPGIFFVEDNEQIVNPCFLGKEKLLTSEGYKTFEELEGKDFQVINKDGDAHPGKVWYSGEKEAIRLRLSNADTISCTPDHVFMTLDGEEVQAKDLIGKKLKPFVNFLFTPKREHYKKEYVQYGFLQGDGNLGRIATPTHKGLEVNLGRKDRDVSSWFGLDKEYSEGIRSYYINGFNEKLLELGFDPSPLTERQFPSSYDRWDINDKAAFLVGCYSANGSVLSPKYGGRVTYKTTSAKFRDQLIQTLTEDFGISCYYTTNKAKDVDFENGKYWCKESYDINIGNLESKVKFIEHIGFIQAYKQNRLKEAIYEKTPSVVSSTSIGVHRVYDFTEPSTHWGVVNGVIVHNCAEIGFWPYLIVDQEKYNRYMKTYDGQGFKQANHEIGVETGWGTCNLSNINTSTITDKDDLLDRARAAATIGTLQAGLDNMGYLGETSTAIVKRDALLGVSMSGIMTHPNITLNPAIQQEVAAVIKETNKQVAELIGINPAARTTCIKPDGNSGCLLECSSSIMPYHSRKYLRWVQIKKGNPIAELFKKINPLAVQQSAAAPTDYSIAFPLETPRGSRTKYEISAIELLDAIKTTQQNFVLAGENEWSRPGIHNNVSNTVTVKSEEWYQVGDYIWDNREFFGGITLLREHGGELEYRQAPFSAVALSEKELSYRYDVGRDALDEISSFADDVDAKLGCVWRYAYDLIEGSKLDEKNTTLGWRLRKGADLASRYFNGDRQRFTYCMKEAYLYNLYDRILKDWKKVNYKMLDPNYNATEDEENTAAGAACAGGSCVLKI
jgi:hypothetical protein